VSRLRLNMMMSLDGYTAGPEQSAENPFGIGGMQLNDWLFPLETFHMMLGEAGGEVNASTPIVEGWFENIGATVMGRNMFGGGPGPWGTNPWAGYWGEDPPYHHPVFVLTHHALEPLQMQRSRLPGSRDSPLRRSRHEPAASTAGRSHRGTRRHAHSVPVLNPCCQDGPAKNSTSVVANGSVASSGMKWPPGRVVARTSSAQFSQIAGASAS
jgi:dihydrofolate reductase